MKIIAEDSEKISILDFYHGKEVRFYFMKATGTTYIHTEDLADALGYKDAHDLFSQDATLDKINDFKDLYPGEDPLIKITPTGENSDTRKIILTTTEDLFTDPTAMDILSENLTNEEYIVFYNILADILISEGESFVDKSQAWKEKAADYERDLHKVLFVKAYNILTPYFFHGEGKKI